MLTVAKLLTALEGLDPDAPVIVGIIDGRRYDAAYADQLVSAGTLSAYICCYPKPRAWEGPKPGTTELGRLLLGLDPDNPDAVEDLEDPDAPDEEDEPPEEV